MSNKAECPYLYLSIETYNHIQGLINEQAKVIDILKRFVTVCQEVDFDTFLTSGYDEKDIELIKRWMNYVD